MWLLFWGVWDPGAYDEPDAKMALRSSRGRRSPPSTWQDSFCCPSRGGSFARPGRRPRAHVDVVLRYAAVEGLEHQRLLRRVKLAERRELRLDARRHVTKVEDLGGHGVMRLSGM